MAVCGRRGSCKRVGGGVLPADLLIFVYQPVMNAVTAISSQGSGSAVTFVHRGVMRPAGPYVSLSKAAYPFGVNNPHGGAFPLSPEGSTR
jgi:hypothetical protein